MLLDDLELAGVGHRPHVDARLEGVPDPDLLGQLDDPGRERFGDIPGDVDPLDRAAALAAVHEGRPDRAPGGPFEVGVLEHDHRVLAAELEGHVGQVPAAELHDPLADPDAAGELDALDVAVDDHRLGFGHAADDDVEDARRQAGLDEDLADDRAP